MDTDAGELARRRAVEDQAVELGGERVELSRQLAKNQGAIVRLLDEAARVGVPLEQVARLVRVRRQSLYRWRHVARERKGAER